MGKHGHGWTGPDLQVRLHAAWDRAEELGTLVMAGLDEGAGQEVLWAAERAWRIDDDRHRGVVVYASALRACAAHEQAEELLLAHVKKYGGNARVWFQLAPLASWRGNDHDVRTALDNALRHDPDSAEALDWGYKYVRGADGDHEADEWLRLRSEHSWRGTLMRADHALERGELETAEDRFAHACELAPRNAEMLLGCARSLATRGYDQECANLVLRSWKASQGVKPMIEAVDALLRLDRAGQAALAMTRLRGLYLEGRDQALVADIDRRVRAACAAAGF